MATENSVSAATPAPVVTDAPAPAENTATASTPSAPTDVRERLAAIRQKYAEDPGAAPAESEPTQEPQKTQAEPPAEKTGSALAKLAREQKLAREATERAKSERAALEKERAEIKAFQEARAAAKRFPLKALAQLGIDPKDVNEALLNDGEPTANLEVKALQDEMAKLRQEQVERERAQVEAERAAALADFQAQCTSFVDTNAEKYELTAKLNQKHLVFQTIEAVWEQSSKKGEPRVLSVEEAAEEVEKSLEAMLDAATKTKKFTAKQQQAHQQSAPTQSPSSAIRTLTKPPAPAPTRTLSNAASAPGSSPAQPESYDERRKRVLQKYGQA